MLNNKPYVGIGFSKSGLRWHEMHCPTLALIGVTALSLLSETLASETIVDRGHRAVDRREMPPLAKIPHHESNGIDGSLFEGPSIDLWQVVGHL